MKGLLLDTHIWFKIANREISFSDELVQEINTIAKMGQLFIAAITLWEIAMLESKNRIQLTTNCLQWLTRSIELTNVQVIDLSTEIAVESCHLPENFNPDPADRIIVATARIHDLCILTADKAILRYGQKKYIKTLAA